MHQRISQGLRTVQKQHGNTQNVCLFMLLCNKHTTLYMMIVPSFSIYKMYMTTTTYLDTDSIIHTYLGRAWLWRDQARHRQSAPTPSLRIVSFESQQISQFNQYQAFQYIYLFVLITV